MKLSPEVQGLLRCPACRAKVNASEEGLACANEACRLRFPVVDGIPVLLNDRTSVFSTAEMVARGSSSVRCRHSKAEALFVRMIPAISVNIPGKRNYEAFSKHLLSLTSRPRVLVVGGGDLGQGMTSLVKNSSIEFVETDVVFGPRAMVLCDGHDLPFEGESFDGVIVQAVLEHVLDPRRCVEEIHRVLKKQGLVYAETPFMQQVHAGRFDFTRFTHLGHRRLFRMFSELDSGAVAGPGTALAWAYQYFLLSFVRSRLLRGLIHAFAGWTSFYLKWFDYFLIRKPGTLDAASAYYFLGRKEEHSLSDKELIQLYRGGQR